MDKRVSMRAIRVNEIGAGFRRDEIVEFANRKCYLTESRRGGLREFVGRNKIAISVGEEEEDEEGSGGFFESGKKKKQSGQLDEDLKKTAEDYHGIVNDGTARS